MENRIFTTVPNRLKITLPKDTFQPGDLILIAKVTKVEMDNYMLTLQKQT